MLDAGLDIGLVLSDRPCRGLTLASERNVAAELIERTDFGPTFDREAYSRHVAEVLGEREIDVVAMAGFGTVLGRAVFDALPDRIINTHPALLPAFPGWHAVPDALSYGVKVTGCTIHVATPVVDDGPILAQEAVAVFPEDDEHSLHERIKQVERRLYVSTLRDILTRGFVLAPEPKVER